MSINVIATVEMLRLLNVGDVSAKQLLAATGFADIKVIYRWIKALKKKGLVFISRWKVREPYYSWNHDCEKDVPMPANKTQAERQATFRAKLRAQANAHGITLKAMREKRAKIKESKAAKLSLGSIIGK